MSTDRKSPSAPPPGPIRADLAYAQAQKGAAGRAVAIALLAGLSLTGLFIGFWVWRLAFADLPPIPDRQTLWSLNRPAGASFVDRNGAAIGQRGPRHGAPLTIQEMPPYLPQAFLAAEDRRFYHHGALDMRGVARAIAVDLKARRLVQGASTITQQIARTLFLSPDQTLRRKLQEAGLAMRIEHLMSKDEILALYLNRIYFGGGAYGVEAAGQVYFGKSARHLTLAEAALLAALPKAPTRLDPANDLSAALRRSRTVLALLVKEGWITQAQASEAAAHPPVLAPQPSSEPDFGYVLDAAAADVRALNITGAPDMVIHLSIDRRLQAEATAAVREAAGKGASVGATQAALVALAPDGGVLALVGGVDRRLSAFNRATQAQRQPGSAFKAFVYAAALEQGIDPDDVREDAPIRIGQWAPQNAEGGYLGNITLKEAFARSINTVAVRLTEEVGPSKVAALARKLGLSTIPPHPAPPIALGAYETSLIDLVSGYQTFQRGGRHPAPWLVDSITNARGDVLYRRAPEAAPQVYDPAKAAEMVSLMQGVIEHGTGRKAALGRPAAGKTGTSQDYRDAWFIGFTPDVAAGVWVGDDKGAPMRRVFGGDLPAETWKRFMLAAVSALPPRPFPKPGAAESDPRDQVYRDLADQLDAAAGAAPAPSPPDSTAKRPAMLGGKL